MKELFQIWSEGYAATGQYGWARCHGHAEGENFPEACDAFARTNAGFAKYYDRDNMTLWGCRLYDNEADTRRAFG